MEQLKKIVVIRWIVDHKQPLAIIGIILTFAIFGAYIASHPAVIADLATISPAVLLLLVVLYCVVIATNAVIIYATVHICKKDLSIKNSLLLTIYSTIINFFGPLQSGPGARAVYLKSKLGVRIRDYTLATFLYYIAFAAINIAFLFTNTQLSFALFGIITSAFVFIFATKKLHVLRPQFAGVIYVTTLLQIIVMSTIYYVEILTIHTPVSFMQALSYGASANLSMFVSITPGAIGIREAFLAFSQSLHHVSLSSIVAAGIIDRAFYVMFLLALLVVSTSLHIKSKLFRKKSA